jgi:hypothetical protein
VCALTNGIATHSYLGVGIAGIDRPSSPWNDASDLEIGGRIEWRWDRFTFALTDFWGHGDLPYADAISSTSQRRSADRPARGGAPAGSGARHLRARRADRARPHEQAQRDVGRHRLQHFVRVASVLGDDRAEAVRALGSGTDVLPDGSPLDGSTAVRGGIGSDPDCLRPGGAPGFTNAYSLDSAAVVAATNALQFSSSNQQLFAWTCLATVGIAAALEPGSCAWTFFASGENLRSANVPIGEAFVSMFAGDPDGPTTVRYLQIVHNFQKDAAQNGALIAFPVASLNRLVNDPQAPIDRNGKRCRRQRRGLCRRRSVDAVRPGRVRRLRHAHGARALPGHAYARQLAHQRAARVAGLRSFLRRALRQRRARDDHVAVPAVGRVRRSRLHEHGGVGARAVVARRRGHAARADAGPIGCRSPVRSVRSAPPRRSRRAPRSAPTCRSWADPRARASSRARVS